MSRIPEPEPAPDRASQGAPHPPAARTLLDLPAIDRDPVHANLPCIQCGYNLRTLAHAGRCPECGTPVAATVRAGELTHMAPTQVRALARCVFLLAVVLGAIGALAFIALVGSWLYDHWAGALSKRTIVHGIGAALIVMTAVFTVFFRLAALAPKPTVAIALISARQILQIWSGIALTLCVVHMGLMFVGDGTLGMLFAACLLVPLVAFTGLVVPFLTAMLLHDIAHQSGRPALAARFGAASELHIGCIVLVSLGVFAAPLMGDFGDTAGLLVLNFWLTLLAAYSTWWAGCTWQLSRALRQVAQMRDTDA